jgi:hypothetical protein
MAAFQKGTARERFTRLQAVYSGFQGLRSPSVLFLPGLFRRKRDEFVHGVLSTSFVSSQIMASQDFIDRFQ